MRILFCILFLLFCIVPVTATSFQAPAVPDGADGWMPQNTQSLPAALTEMMQTIVPALRPDLAEALRIGAAMVAIAILVSLLQSSKSAITFAADLSGTVCAAAIMLGSSKSLVNLAADTISELAQYSKLFFPVVAAGLAAQGAPVSSAGLYIGTSMFTTLLSNIMSSIAVPIIYLFLAFSTAYCAVSEETLKKTKEQLKTGITWFLKTALSMFITYMGITGAISGTTDAAKLKAAKTAVSTMIPVLGGTLSNASEAILIGAGLAKNAAGIYGIYAMLAIFLAPFLRIGVHYLILKATSMICGLFDAAHLSALADDFASAMGLLLAITGALCMLLLISAICFMKGGM